VHPACLAPLEEDTHMKTFSNRHARTAAGAVLVAALGTPAVLWAQPGPGWGGERRGGMMGKGPGVGGMRDGGPGAIALPLRQLNLTEQQRAQVRSIMESHQQEFRANGERMREAHRALHQVVTAPTVDESAIRAASSNLAEVMADGAVLRARVHSEVYALLTPEQRQRATELRQQFEQRRDQRLELRRERMEQRRQQVPPRGGGQL
jgi:periplasmic protein CpxP/Spy